MCMFCLQNACSDKLRCVQEFVDYPKCAELLELKIRETYDEDHVEHKKLKDCCRTRWIEEVDSFDIFSLLFKAIILALSTVAMNENEHWNNDSVTLASNLLHGISTFEFLVTLEI